MNKSSKFLFKTISFFLLVALAVQVKAQKINDSVIFRALKDELNSNMQHLRKKEYANPFFIAYRLSHTESYNGSASNGTIFSSGKRVYRSNYARLMVGNYELNDENFIVQSMSFDPGSYTPETPIPLDDDYYGIRQNFWQLTDGIYKSAAKNYEKKRKILKEGKLPDDFEMLPDFSREKATHIEIDENGSPIVKSQLDSLLKEYSAILSNYPDLSDSKVLLATDHTVHFFVNSEGTRVKYPMDCTMLTFLFQCHDKDYRMLNDFLIFQADHPEELPAREEIALRVRQLADSLVALSKRSPEFEDYYGPVLFTGEASAEIMSALLMNNSSSLIAARAPLMIDSRGNIYQGQMFSNNTNGSLHRKVMSPVLNITARTHLNQFQGIKLTGNFTIDAEGVVPPGELALVRKGMLVNQLNDRTPAKDIPRSNGHSRFQSGSANASVCPGILDVTVEGGGMSGENLKSELLKKAREEGLDHVYIVRRAIYVEDIIPLDVVRIDLETGRETPVRLNATISLNENILRQLNAFSSGRMVINTQSNTGGFGGSLSMLLNLAGNSGCPVSLILPDAFIAENATFNNQLEQVSISRPVVPEPVAIEKK